MYPFCNLNTLKMIYLAYIHTVMEYGISFWGVSVESKRIFKQQKRIIRIMTGSTSRISCRTLFRKLEILTLTYQYILSSMRFLSSNLEIFTFNTSAHTTNTRIKLKLHVNQHVEQAIISAIKTSVASSWHFISTY